MSAAKPVIVILTNYLNYTDGVSRHIYDLITGFHKFRDEFDFIVICDSGDAVDMYAAAGIKYFTLKHFSHSARSIHHFISCTKNIMRICKEENVALLHSHSHYQATMAALVGKFLRLPTVQTNHGIIPEVGVLPHFIADKYIVINEHVVEYVRDVKHFPENKYFFIRCGIPVRYSGCEKSNEPVTFIAAGRLDITKGFDLYVRAAAAIKEQGQSGVTFLLAGSGEEKEKLLQLNDSLGSPVHYAGTIKDMPELFSHTHVLINPSRSLMEGFPRTIVEAVFADNFLITSRFRGVENDFDETKDGKAFAVDNLTELISAITWFLTNRGEAEKRRIAFKEKALGLFAQEIMIEKTGNLYQSLIK